MSMMDIVGLHRESSRAEQGDRLRPSSQKFKRTFQVTPPNVYEESSTPLTVQVTIIDIIFQDKVCNLLYIQDLTKLVQDADIFTNKPPFDLSGHQAETN